MARVTLLGGVGEIGGNVILVEEDGQSILLDAGMPLHVLNQYFDLYEPPRGVNPLRDLLAADAVPRLKGLYRQDLVESPASELAHDPEGNRPDLPSDLFRVDDAAWAEPGRLHGLLLSHAHADHVDLLPYVRHDLPVHATRETLVALDVIENTMKKNYVTGVRARLHKLQSGPSEGGSEIKHEDVDRTLGTLPRTQPTRVGPFQVIAVPVDHSIPGSVAMVIVTPRGKRIVYSGDLRAHGRRGAETRAFLDTFRGYAPDLLLIEGTRVDETVRDDENGVRDGILAVVRGAPGLVTVDFSWRDTDRLLTVHEVAKAAGRTLAADPRALLLLDRLHRVAPASYPDPRTADSLLPFVPRRGTGAYRAADYRKSPHLAGWSTDWKQGTGPEEWAHLERGVTAVDIRRRPASYILHLGAFQLLNLVDIAPPPGSVAIRATTEPFSDEMELDMARVGRWLRRYEFQPAPAELALSAEVPELHHLHASGHAGQQDLFAIVQALQPKLTVPIHTEHPQAYAAATKDLEILPADRARVARGEAVVEV